MIYLEKKTKFLEMLYRFEYLKFHKGYKIFIGYNNENIGGERHIFIRINERIKRNIDKLNISKMEKEYYKETKEEFILKRLILSCFDIVTKMNEEKVDKIKKYIVFDRKNDEIKNIYFLYFDDLNIIFPVEIRFRYSEDGELLEKKFVVFTILLTEMELKEFIKDRPYEKIEGVRVV